METDRLKYFVTVAELGSLTKASELLGISHSGLSKAISALENELHLKLFRPQGRGLQITPEGSQFYTQAQEIINLIEGLRHPTPTTLASLRLGLSGAISIKCSGLLSAEFHCPISFFETEVNELEGKILSGDLDFGVAFIPSLQPELEYLHLGNVTFGSFARADLLERTALDRLPFCVPMTELSRNPLGYKNRDGWPLGISRHVQYHSENFGIALDLLREGRAVVYMPEFVSKLENMSRGGRDKIVKIKHFKDAETQRKLFLVKRKSIEESSAMKKVAKVIRRICCV